MPSEASLTLSERVFTLSERSESKGCRFLAALLLALSVTGCPRPPLPPPPKGTGGPATQMLAARDARIGAVRASAVIRTRIPEGRQGAPGGKLSAIVLVAARPSRARLEILTPFGTPAATLLLADGLFQAYDPFAHRVMQAPIDSPRVTEMLGAIPLPMTQVPSLIRGAVALEGGEITETKVPGDPALTPPVPDVVVVEVRRDGRVAQQVRVHAEGGYPLEDLHFEPVSGRSTLRVTYADYGGVETPSGAVAFPQKITARVHDEAGQEAASVEVKLSTIELDPTLGEAAFRLVFDRPPEVQEL